MYKIEIVPDKTKVVTNNPNDFEEIKVKGRRLNQQETKDLGPTTSNEGSKPKILSRITHNTSALSRLKVIWSDKSISLAFNNKRMRTLILCP